MDDYKTKRQVHPKTSQKLTWKKGNGHYFFSEIQGRLSGSRGVPVRRSRYGQVIDWLGTAGEKRASSQEEAAVRSAQAAAASLMKWGTSSEGAGDVCARRLGQQNLVNYI